MVAIKDIVVVEPAGYWKSAKYIHIHNMIIMIQRKFQLRRLVIVLIVTPLKFRINLYYTGPVATSDKTCKICEVFFVSGLYPFFSSSNPFLNRFRIRTCSIWSQDKYSSNVACTYSLRATNLNAIDTMSCEGKVGEYNSTTEIKFLAFIFGKADENVRILSIAYRLHWLPCLYEIEEDKRRKPV